MQVTTWRNGSQNNETGAGFGIRIRKTDFETMRNWTQLFVGGVPIYREERAFTEKCPEIRSKLIGIYLIENGLNEWLRGHPHTLILERISETIFRLRL